MVLATDCPQVQITHSMQQVLLEMTAKPTGLCFVLKENTFAGIIVEGDIRRALTKNENALSFSADKIMNKNPRKISSLDLAYDALKLMESGERPITVLPVIDGDQIKGLIRLHDLLREGFPSSQK
jgi:arabinose-5-phosphate isomerase